MALSNRAALWFTLLALAGLLIIFSWILMQRIGVKAQKKARLSERETVHPCTSPAASPLPHG